MLLNKALNLYHHAWENRDKRMDDQLLMDNAFYTIFLSFCYLIFSVFIGPWFMRNRKPYNLRSLIIAYNVIMVVINVYIHYMGWIYGVIGRYKFTCKPVDISNSPQALGMAAMCYAYFVTKFIDWFDTVFFILRKKFTHVTVLHVYHHFIMPINLWFLVRFSPGAYFTLIPFLNTFVHIVMYSYYALAALKPEWQKYLWWKKYITVLQMLQFIIALVISIAIIFSNCDLPKFFMYVGSVQAFLFLVLFSNFYIQTYYKEPCLNHLSKTHVE